MRTCDAPDGGIMFFTCGMTMLPPDTEGVAEPFECRKLAIPGVLMGEAAGRCAASWMLRGNGCGPSLYVI